MVQIKNTAKVLFYRLRSSGQRHWRLSWLGISAKKKGGTISRRNVLLLASLLLWGIPNAHAQGKFEVTPFFGARFGGTIDLAQQNNPNADFLKIKSSSNYGILADVSFLRHFQGEFTWSRQPTSLSVHNPNDGTYTYFSKLNLDMYQFGLTYQFRKPEAKVRPFIVAGGGVLALRHPGDQRPPAICGKSGWGREVLFHEESRHPHGRQMVDIRNDL